MLKHYIRAARLRTLPLSVSGIIVGSSLAATNGYFDLWTCILAFLTTIGFQIISNFANDYGDGVKGTDNEDRVGPERMIQSGQISPKQLMNVIKVSVLITFLIAVLLIYRAFGIDDLMNITVFVILGIASIVAAIKYTVGKKAYGYSGLGDVFVLMFFGLLSVVGSFYLFTKHLEYTIFLPAFSIGFLSMGVLNLNNMRDRASDIKSGKNTLIVKIGAEFGKYYHYYLLVASFLLLLLYVIVHWKSISQFLFVIGYLPILIHGLVVYKNKNPELLDPELKKLALSTVLVAVLFGLGHIIA